jgi:hypothetical protein
MTKIESSKFWRSQCTAVGHRTFWGNHSQKPRGGEEET